jgi:hypothetical protein
MSLGADGRELAQLYRGNLGHCTYVGQALVFWVKDLSPEHGPCGLPAYLQVFWVKDLSPEHGPCGLPAYLHVLAGRW